jgi:hypothetical protein
MKWKHDHHKLIYPERPQAGSGQTFRETARAMRSGVAMLPLAVHVSAFTHFAMHLERTVASLHELG